LQEQYKAVPLSQKRLADTYIVGGYSSDLTSAFSTQKNATMVVHSVNQVSGKHPNEHLISKASKQNQNRVLGQKTGPIQLEPNPVFSIIDAQMEKLNKTNQEREDALIRNSRYSD
jgi:hypothetical protein